MKIIAKSGGRYIFDPEDVFAQCIEEHGDFLKEYMYMDSIDATTHNFKNIISRKYITVCT